MINLALLLSGPGPLPEYLPGDAGALDCLPFVLLGIVVIAMVFSALCRFCEPVREFSASRVCAFMEKYGQKEGL